jgi:hypothetical protein
VTFLSLILHGGYAEKRGAGTRRHRWFNFIRATEEDTHTIIRVEPNTVTLCLMGPKVRNWGFDTHLGWCPWQEYNRLKYKGYDNAQTK